MTNIKNDGKGKADMRWELIVKSQTMETTELLKLLVKGFKDNNISVKIYDQNG